MSTKPFLRLGLVGGNVENSPSPALHKFLLSRMGADCDYQNFSLPEEELIKRLLNGSLFALDGFNVTMPYKRTVLPYLNGLSGAAARLLSVNTVLTKQRLGLNTDCGGFALSLAAAGICVKGARALVLGAGGAGRSCIGALFRMGAEVSVYEKEPSRLWEAKRDLPFFTPLEQVAGTFDLVCNCTGVGMHGSEGQLPKVKTPHGEEPFCGAYFSGVRAAVDLIYAPPISAFLSEAEACGAKICNGAGMLFFQAYLADCAFLGRTPRREEAERLKMQFEEENR